VSVEFALLDSEIRKLICRESSVSRRLLHACLLFFSEALHEIIQKSIAMRSARLLRTSMLAQKYD